MRRTVLALAATIFVAGCGGTTPLGEDYDSEFDVVVAFCSERIHLDETCETIESSTADEVYSYALFGNAAGHTVHVVREIIQGGDSRYETDPRLVPAGERLLDGILITREACTDSNCKVVIRAFVDDAEVAKAGFAFVGR